MPAAAEAPLSISVVVAQNGPFIENAAIKVTLRKTTTAVVEVEYAAQANAIEQANADPARCHFLSCVRSECVPTATIATTAAAIGKTGSASYSLTNLWTGATSATTGTISASVPAHGTVMYRVAGGSASTNPSGEIHATGAAKCLDVPNSAQANGTQLDIWTCGGASNQIWTLTSGQLTVYSGSSEKCLDAFNNQTTSGTKVEIWTCNGGANQQWAVNSNGTITGTQSGLCLDVTGASTANGALVELWTCNGQSNQQWTLG